MMVYVVDRRIPQAPRRSGIGSLAAPTGSFDDRWSRVINDLPGHENAQIRFVDPSDSFGDICDWIVSVAGPRWNIYMLRIICHGAPAYLELGRGVRNAEAREFRRVSHYMTPSDHNGKGLEIHGCNVAEGGSGRSFVQNIANRITTPVVASPIVQLADNRFAFEGDVSRFEPR